MTNTRVLLSVEQQLERQLIQYSLDRFPDVEIIGKSLSVFEIMALIAQCKPHVWIHSFGDGPDYRTLRTHVCSVAPELIIVTVNPDDPCGFLQVPVNSIDDLISHSLRFAEGTESFLSSNQSF